MRSTDGPGALATDSFARFAEHEWPRLVGMLGLLCGSAAVAEELAQEALIRAYERWSTVAQLDSPGGWTHRVAVNLGRSHLRRRLAAQRARSRLANDALPTQPAVDEATWEVQQAVSELPPRLRAAVVLRYYSGLSPEEVGVALGITPGAVRVRTHRGLARLRSRLALEDDDPARDAPRAARP